MHLSSNFLAAFSLSCLINTAACYRNWTYNIPPAEAEALAGIVEDVPPAAILTARDAKPESDLLVKRKDNLSPVYPLIYRNPLPIPPVKEPLKYVRWIQKTIFRDASTYHMFQKNHESCYGKRNILLRG